MSRPFNPRFNARLRARARGLRHAWPRSGRADPGVFSIIGNVLGGVALFVLLFASLFLGG